MWPLLFLLAQPPDTPAPPIAPSITAEPDRIRTEPGRSTVLRVKSNGTAIRWVFVDDGLNPLDPKLLRDPATAVVTPLKTGVYRVLCYTALGGIPSEPVWIVVEVGSLPIPPLPGPQPPHPVPPAPVDPFVAELQKLYDVDTTTDKPMCRARLADLYRVAGAAIVNDPSMTTLAPVMERLRAASRVLIPDGCLKALRDRLSAESATKLAPLPATLTPESRKTASEHFLRLAALLDGVH